MESKKVLDFIGLDDSDGGGITVIGVLSLEPPQAVEFEIIQPSRVKKTLEDAYEDCHDIWVDKVRGHETILGYREWFDKYAGTDEQKIALLYDHRYSEHFEDVLRLANAPEGSEVSVTAGNPLISVSQWFPGKRSEWESAITAGWKAVGEENKFVTGEW